MTAVEIDSIFQSSIYVERQGLISVIVRDTVASNSIGVRSVAEVRYVILEVIKTSYTPAKAKSLVAGIVKSWLPVL